ncbi:hypothetical protein FRC06_004367 [Ceratobasidium sp. 370]|nr:hypothetical protein FRC06_004367 [Ceratobasidium sp. 370]
MLSPRYRSRSAPAERPHVDTPRAKLGDLEALGVGGQSPRRQRALTWFVTEVPCRSRASIDTFQATLAYSAAEIHNQLRITTDSQAKLAIQIARFLQPVRHVLMDMDWLGSEFTPSPLIHLRRVFLPSLGAHVQVFAGQGLF